MMRVNSQHHMPRDNVILLSNVVNPVLIQGHTPHCQTCTLRQVCINLTAVSKRERCWGTAALRCLVMVWVQD